MCGIVGTLGPEPGSHRREVAEAMLDRQVHRDPDGRWHFGGLLALAGAAIPVVARGRHEPLVVVLEDRLSRRDPVLVRNGE